KGPAFSAVVGLLIYPQVAGLETSAGKNSGLARKMTGTGGRLGWVGQWLKESF
ncbi:MAG: cell division protein FtsA, partial [Nitratireductor sp.]|nr:cell division protein FtsA [Nitratireductor sp.]